MNSILDAIFDGLVIYGLFFADSQPEDEESLENDGDIIFDEDNDEESNYISDRNKILYEYDE